MQTNQFMVRIVLGAIDRDFHSNLTRLLVDKT